MASGSSKGFDFASDDILCSYDNQQHSDPPIPTNSNQEFNKSRMARTDNNEEVIIMAVDRSVKKHTDNVMRFLEGLSSRLSQLELYCYNLDKSIGEMRSDLTQDHVESEAKLKFLEKHLQEVHRSVQILRDKQELADTQKELAKLQIARKESSSSHDSKNDTPGNRKNETPVDSHGQHLALVPAPAPAPAPQPPPMTQPQHQPQTHAYYLPPGPTPTQHLQAQMPPQVQSVPQYQQQWTPQVQPPPSMQPGSVASKPSSPQVYPQYLPTKPSVNPSPEPHPTSMPMQMTYSTITPPGSNQPVAYSYGPPVRATQPQPPPPQQLPQQQKPGFGHQSGTGDGYPPNGYMVYDNGSGRVQHLSQGGNMYPPGQQHSGGGGVMVRPPQQFMRNHPYGEVIDKLVSMGYRWDHVMSVIQRMDETGQTVEFNGVLDRLNGHSSGRVWSG